MKRVNPMTLTSFAKKLREHGIPCSPEAVKAWICAGVFGQAAVACPSTSPHEKGKIYYFIRPKLVDEWIEANADAEREEEELDW